MRPELVKMDALQGTRFEYSSAFYTPDFSLPSRVSVAATMDQLSPIGAFGFPEHGTAENGERLFATAAKEVVAFVREFATWQPFPQSQQ